MSTASVFVVCFGLPCSNGDDSRVVDVTQFPEDTGSEREKKRIVYHDDGASNGTC